MEVTLRMHSFFRRSNAICLSL